MIDSNPYRPSFYIVKDDRFVEVVPSNNRQLFINVHIVIELYDYPIDIIDDDEYYRLHTKFSSIVPTWELPTKVQKFK